MSCYVGYLIQYWTLETLYELDVHSSCLLRLGRPQLATYSERHGQLPITGFSTCKALTLRENPLKAPASRSSNFLVRTKEVGPAMRE